MPIATPMPRLKLIFMSKNFSDILFDKSILVVDDDYATYVLITALLEKTGAKMQWAENGLKAVEFVNRNPNIDLILMDLQMPVMDGRQAIKHITKINNEIPIIIQSCNIENFHVKDEMKSPNIGFIEKPYDLNELIKKVLKAMKVHTE